MSSLIVFHLPKSITKNNLKDAFSQKGNVTNVQLIFTADEEFCYFALIAYETEDEAIGALNYFDKLDIFSTRIRVERCSERGQITKTNLTGKKVYSKSFLLHLGSKPVCQKKHDVLTKDCNHTMISSNSSKKSSLKQ